MKASTAISALALFSSAVVAQNATADPFAAITTLAPYAKCALGPAYSACDAKLAERDACNATEPVASASCSCAYASSRMACNAICTDAQIDIAIGCPKPTSWSVYPGWGSSSASTTKSSNYSVSTKSYSHGGPTADCSETTYTGSWSTKPYASKPTGGSWAYSESGKPSTWVSGPGSWSTDASGSASWAYATSSTSSAMTTPTVVMQTKNDAARPTGAAAVAALALAGVAGALL